jgi:hypothetical protein
MPEKSEKYETEGTFFDYLLDSFWASLPEQTADDLAACKKDALNSVRNFVTSVIDDELSATDRRLENARRMREQYRQAAAEDAPPNPA